MKVFIFSYREEEQAFFESYCNENGVTYAFTPEGPSVDKILELRDYTCVSVVTTPIDKSMLDAMKSVGIKYISTRTMGMDHIDVTYANEIGITVGNVGYEPSIVAEYAVMMMMMVSRHVKTILSRFQQQDFSLVGVRGRLLKNQTVGVIGTGRIGQQVIHYLEAYGCEIVAYDLYKQPTLEGRVNYLPLKELLKVSDIITLHLPATEENYHMIDKEAIFSMKKGAAIVNTARGPLIDSMAMIEGLETGQLGGVALDVVEDESYLYYRDLKSEPISNRALNLLRAFPNAILTPHTAFYTKEAVEQMAQNSIAACMAFMKV